MFMNCTGNDLLDVKHDGFDKPITLGSDKISGNIEIEADRCSAEFYDIKITDIATGNVKTYENLSFSNGGKAVIDSIDSNHYKVEFTAKRTAGDKGFRLFFGKSDDKT